MASRRGRKQWEEEEDGGAPEAVQVAEDEEDEEEDEDEEEEEEGDEDEEDEDEDEDEEEAKAAPKPKPAAAAAAASKQQKPAGKGAAPADDEDDIPRNANVKGAAPGGDEDEAGVEDDIGGGAGGGPRQAVRVTGLVRVLPYLLIGDVHGASKLQALQEQKVVHVVNCASEEVEDFFPDQLEYTSIPATNSANYKLNDHFEQVYGVIAHFRDAADGTSVLVHDETGQHQAAALVLAYMLMSAHQKRKAMTLKAALKYLQGKKPDISVRDAFLKQLVRLEKDLFGESSMRIRSSGGRDGKSHRVRGGGGARRGRGRGGRGRRGKK